MAADVKESFSYFLGYTKGQSEEQGTGRGAGEGGRGAVTRRRQALRRQWRQSLSCVGGKR